MKKEKICNIISGSVFVLLIALGWFFMCKFDKQDAIAVQVYAVEPSEAAEQVIYHKVVKLQTEKKPETKSHVCCQNEDAHTVWKELKRMGMTDQAAAGVLGNIMVECGGGTLDLDTEIYSDDGFYGICQWGAYYPEVHGADLRHQLWFLNDTIQKEFEAFGEVFGCSYDKFITLENESDAALLFAQVYERCDAFSYGARQEAASDALNHFGGAK